MRSGMSIILFFILFCCALLLIGLGGRDKNGGKQ